MERSIQLSLSTLSAMIDEVFVLLPNVFIALIVFVGFLIVSKNVKCLTIKMAEKAHLDLTLAHALGTLSVGVTNVCGVLVAAVIVIPHFSLAGLVGGLGISSVAIGFAFKDILQNFFAGMLLLWEKPFSIGDQIRTKDLEGTVEDIDIRYTQLRTHDGELVFVPNGDILINPIIVDTGFSTRKVLFDVVVKDPISIEDARALILSAVNAVEGVEKEPPPRVYLKDPTADTLAFTVQFFAPSRHGSMVAVSDRVATMLRKALNHPEGNVKIEDDEAGGLCGAQAAPMRVWLEPGLSK